MGSTAQRVVAVIVLLGAGILSLPLAAAVLDSRRAESWIIPVQLLIMAAIGAAIAVALPAMARAGASTGARALTGVAWGLLAALTGLLVFWLLLNGFRGA
jgi:hypothetical protein